MSITLLTAAQIREINQNGAVNQQVQLGTRMSEMQAYVQGTIDDSVGIKQFAIGTLATPDALLVNPGATVIANLVNISHELGAGDCGDMIASYAKASVTGVGDSGLTVVGSAPRAYVGVTGGSNNSVAAEVYGCQPWARHQGTGAVTAISGLSAKMDVGADAFTVTTANAGHFHIDGAATVTSSMFDGVMIEVYPTVTCLDAALRICADTGAVVAAAIKPQGAFTNVIDFQSVTPGTATNGVLFTTGSTWLNFATANQKAAKLLCSNSATTGDYSTLCMRARSDAAGATVCINASASAGANNHGNLYAVQGYAQPNAYTQNDASNIVCGLYSCIDRTAGGTSVGRDWSTWIDTHMAVKASGGSYLLRMSHNGTIANDGAITIYNGGRMPVLFNFEDAAGFLTETGDAGSTKAGYLAVKTPAGTKYIQLVTV